MRAVTCKSQLKHRFRLAIVVFYEANLTARNETTKPKRRAEVHDIQHQLEAQAVELFHPLVAVVPVEFPAPRLQFVPR